MSAPPIDPAPDPVLDPALTDEQLQTFQSARSAHLLHLILLIVSSQFVWLGAYYLYGNATGPLFPAHLLTKILFVHYSLFFALMWLGYFLYPSRFRTLRLLLRTAGQAQHEQDLNEGRSADTGTKNDAIREKATVSLTVSAMMVAASAVIFSIASDTYIDLGLPPNQFVIDLTHWEMVMLGLSSIFSITAFILFILTSDILDTLLNRFVPGDKVNLTQHFYLFTSNPKYLGMLSLVLSACCLISYHSATLAAYSLALFMSVGYHYWFPNFSRELGISHARAVIITSRTIRLILVILPFVLANMVR